MKNLVTDDTPEIPSEKISPIDCHVHIFGSSLDVAQPIHPHPERAAELTDVMKVSSNLGIRRFVLIQPSFLRNDNSLIETSVAAHPQELRGVVWIDSSLSPDSLAALAGNGIVGLRFPILYSATFPDWHAYADLFAVARAHAFHVELCFPGQPLIEALHTLLDYDLNIVIPHLGMFDKNLGPDRDPCFAALIEASITRRVWVKLSAPYRAELNHCNRACDMLLAHFGPDRLIWGSDWPHVGPKLDREKTYGESMSWFRQVIPETDIQRKILIEVPSVLYKFS